MTELTLTMTAMAHGGQAMGRDKNGRSIFVPTAIPGETVRVRLTEEKRNFARAELLEIIEPSPQRTLPQCRYFELCGGCHFQHMSYEAQLETKQAVVQDQLARLGRLPDVTVRPTLPNPTPWAYRQDVAFSPTEDGRLGFWAPREKRVIPIDECPITAPELLTILQDLDMELPGLRKLTARLGVEDERLVALEIDDVDPPELLLDFPLSVTMVLPDQTAVSLIGDIDIVKAIGDKEFQVSPGCDFPVSPAAAEKLIETVLRYANLSGRETVLEGYAGVGTLTAYLAPHCAELHAVEVNPDALEDMAVNLEETDNVSAYEGFVEEVLPDLTIQPVVLIVHPDDDGLSEFAIRAISQKRPKTLITIYSNVAKMARDGRELTRAGFKAVEFQPIDMQPQTYHTDVVGLWRWGR